MELGTSFDLVVLPIQRFTSLLQKFENTTITTEWNLSGFVELYMETQL